MSHINIIDPWRDVFDVEILEGDEIVYARSRGNSVELRKAIVLYWNEHRMTVQPEPLYTNHVNKKVSLSYAPNLVVNLQARNNPSIKDWLHDYEGNDSKIPLQQTNR